LSDIFCSAREPLHRKVAFNQWINSQWCTLANNKLRTSGEQGDRFGSDPRCTQKCHPNALPELFGGVL